MSGIVTTLPAAATGPGTADLKLWIPPLPIAGAALRYTTMSLSSGQIGSPIAEIPDLTGTGASILQSTGAMQPLLMEAAGIRFLRFDGVDDRIGAARPFNQPLTIFTVARVRALPAAGVVNAFWRTGNNSINHGVNSAGLPSVHGGVSAGTLNNAVTVNAFQIHTAVLNPGAAIIGLNASESAPLNLGTTQTIADIRLGQGSDNLACSTDVAELLIFPSVLTAAERTLVRSTLAETWGIQI